MNPQVAHLRGVYVALHRHRDSDDPELLQARRALALASTEAKIADALDAAPPLDAATVAKLHSLIPPPADLPDEAA